VPVVSRREFRAMKAAEEGKSKLGIPKAVGAEFVKATPKGLLTSLPERVNKKKRATRPKGLM
jgi:hypothetical protein